MLRYAFFLSYNLMHLLMENKNTHPIFLHKILINFFSILIPNLSLSMICSLNWKRPIEVPLMIFDIIHPPKFIDKSIAAENEFVQSLRV